MPDYSFQKKLILLTTSKITYALCRIITRSTQVRRPSNVSRLKSGWEKRAQSTTGVGHSGGDLS